MSYAIIRNEKYKQKKLNEFYRHNERKNKTYSNPNIDHTKSHLNYSLKDPIYSYGKEFDKIKETYNLKGQIKTVINIACQYINLRSVHFVLAFINTFLYILKYYAIILVTIIATTTATNNMIIPIVVKIVPNFFCVFSPPI